MRININASGVAAMQDKLLTLDIAIENTIQELKSVKRDINNVNGGTSRLDDAVRGIDNRIRTETNKQDNLFEVADKFVSFLDNAVSVDKQVARQVKQEQKKLYSECPWLKPQDSGSGSGFWKKLSTAWNEFWDDAGEWLGNLVDNIVDWVKEHAVELIVGLVCIVVAAVLTYLTGGAFLAALGAFLKAAAISALIGGAVSGVVALVTGGDFWDAFGDGLASGFMWGGIFSAISTTITAIRGVIKGASVVDDVVTNADDVVNAADDVVNNSDDAANVADDVVNNADDAIKTFEAPGGLKEKYPKAYEHLKGEVVNGKAKGYHYNTKGSNGTVQKIVAGPDKYGVYNAKVSINGIEKKALSSMFPDGWTAQQVSSAIDEAVTLASKMPVKPNVAYAHTVNISGGMPIRVCFDKMGKIVNVFPVFTP